MSNFGRISRERKGESLMKQRKRRFRMAALITVLSVLVFIFCGISSVSDKEDRGDRKPVLSGRRTGKNGFQKKTSMHSTPSISGGSIIMEM